MAKRPTAAPILSSTDISTTLTTAQDWVTKRDEIVSELTRVRDTANRLLQELTGANMAVAVRRGRPPGVAKTKKGGRRKGFKMSAEARAKIAAAQKKRWAKAKKDK